MVSSDVIPGVALGVLLVIFIILIIFIVWRVRKAHRDRRKVSNNISVVPVRQASVTFAPEIPNTMPAPPIVASLSSEHDKDLSGGHEALEHGMSAVLLPPGEVPEEEGEGEDSEEEVILPPRVEAAWVEPVKETAVAPPVEAAQDEGSRSYSGSDSPPPPTRNTVIPTGLRRKGEIFSFPGYDRRWPLDIAIIDILNLINYDIKVSRPAVGPNNTYYIEGHRVTMQLRNGTVVVTSGGGAVRLLDYLDDYRARVIDVHDPEALKRYDYQ